MTTTTNNCLHRYATVGEARVARKLVKAALDAGYTVSVCDGEEWTVKRAWRLKTVLDALASTGEDILRIRDASGESCGTFELIWGNDPSGEELIADHTDNAACEALYKAAHGDTAKADAQARIGDIWAAQDAQD